MLILLFMFISMHLCLLGYLKETRNYLCQHIKSLGSYDIACVWMVLWQICVTSRGQSLFETWHQLGTWRLWEHGSQNPDIYCL